ncbi:CubicO group peptidase (beta-lactamase class C family) [Aquimarina sp. EL_43]|uniref:serine hydrolase domain-containing protein n=1 Tax=unclassified Aquimarina TaxID=2627091 RepID=UPI0018C9B3DA|nr:MULTISPECIES: serine hydrolase domain-containing protein [unclassified Aquimarina]MBG6132859.1 CubicO group peptidase (beta-lactamase class C family) [Aquimarina sp. EL_35]MBG6153064.1 CubicO group peptidase (beta-lactamase class C family) [Aquimarina sp. EL_32]MBG6171220.1 CubicO group peptidase (beta-lactamase class C family) [Aquimarina sp. EL_43]
MIHQSSQKPIRILLFIVIIIFFFNSCSNSPKSLDALMQEYTENGRKKISSPFNGVILVAKKGKITFKKAYGLKDREQNIPNIVDTKFPIGSVTKQFTAMLVMQLVEEGTIKLEDSVSTHLSYFPKELGNKITIHQLLSHTSGLPHYEGILRTGITQDAFISTAYTPRELAILVGKVKLAYEPGTTFYYSSLGYMLLGAILEEVSKKSFSELLETKITKPLGLKNTGYETNEFIKNETAKGYSFIEDETFRMIFMKYGGNFNNVPFRDQSNIYATGGIHSTVDDLFIWSEAIRTNKLLSAAYTKKMLTPNKHGYCYGWIRNWDDLIERNTKIKMYTHGGALHGHRSSINIFDDGTTIIFLSNVSPIKDREIIHQLYLTAHGLEDVYKMKGYPDRSSLDEFKKNGGIKALNSYFEKLSELCGYKVLPSETSVGHIMYLYYQNGNQRIADSIKQSFLKNYNPTENSINRLGYKFLDDNCELAIEFFKENTKRYPNSPNVWDSLGEGFLVCESYNEAITSYSKAIELGEKTNHHSVKLFKENLQHAKKKSGTK